jgi:hypothetical protein
MSEITLLQRPRYQDYPMGRRDMRYHEDLAKWNAQKNKEKYVSLDKVIEEQVAEDKEFVELSDLKENISSLDNTNTYRGDGTSPITIIENSAYPISGISSSQFVTEPQPVGAGGYYAQQQKEEQAVKEFEQDIRAENIRTAELTDYERTQESSDAENVISLREQNVSGLYDAYKSPHKDLFSDGFNASTTQDKIAFYYKLYQEGEIDGEEYKNVSASQLQLDNPENIYFFDDGDLFSIPTNPNVLDKGVSGQVTLFPTDVVDFKSLSKNADGNFIDTRLTGFEPESLTNEENFNYAIGATNIGIDPLDDDSVWVRDIRPFATLVGRSLLAAVTGGQSESWYSLYKVANGETLHGSDYANLILSGLETTGAIQAPTDTTSGFGLGNLTYDQTTGIVNALADKDPVTALFEYTGYDTNFIEKGLNAVGIDADTFGADSDAWTEGFNKIEQTILTGGSGTDEFVDEFGGDIVKGVADYAGDTLVSAGELAGDLAGGVLGDTVDLLDDTFDYIGDTALVGAIEAGGKALGGAIESGVNIVGEAGQGVIDLGKDIGEAVVDTTDDLIDTFGKEVVDPALQEGKKVAEAVVDKADEALDYLGEEYVDPALQQGKEIGQDIIDKGKDIGEGIVDTVDNVVDKFGEEAVDPALAKAKDLGQDLIDKGKDAGEFVVDTVDDALDYLGEEYVDPALQALKDIELPEGPELEFPKIDIDLPELNVDLPEFTAPDIDFPEIDIDLPEVDIDLPSIDLAESEEKEPQQPTQVEGLFDKELFKFDTKIKSTQQMLSPLMNLRRYG